MRKRIYNGIVSVISLAMIISCSFGEPDGRFADDQSEQKETYTPLTKVGSDYKRMMDISFSSLERIVEKSVEYDALDTGSISRAVFGDGSISVEDFSKYINVNAVKKGSSRSAEGDETTLGDELKQIAAEFTELLAEMKPDTTFLESFEETAVVDGALIIGGDVIIKPDTISGIITLELMEAQLKGEDMEEVYKDFNMVADSYDEEPDADRGVYKFCDPLWPYGRVQYAYGLLLQDGHKRALNTAMREWEAKTNNAVKFINVTDNIALQAISFIGLTNIREYTSGWLPDGTTGVALPGSLQGRWLLTISSNADLSDDRLLRTARHELGHVLGLWHEHQRWDRDNYIEIPSDKSWDFVNYGLIHKYLMSLPISSFILVPVTVKIFGIKIRIYVLALKIVGVLNIGQLADGSDAFDYESVMLYGKPIKTKRDVIINGKLYHKGKELDYNNEISAQDAATVRKMYR